MASASLLAGLLAALATIQGVAPLSVKVHQLTLVGDDGQRAPVRVVIDESRQVALVTPTANEHASVSLYDFHQRVVAHRTGSTEECFLERLQEDFFEHQSRLEAIRDQVVVGPAETLYTWNVNLTDHETGEQAGRRVRAFCAGATATWLSPQRPTVLEFHGIEYPVNPLEAAAWSDDLPATAEDEYRIPLGPDGADRLHYQSIRIVELTTSDVFSPL
ncbi:hypothetical protein FJT64_021659 [Amphibalanus amphitrite]|uniref:Uncharacterized protein n=1 Tax=Amphibalanus amphitrite TaxID=1232801 RepID=A0A6A4WSY9_AMPAM|nr:hypothetical protein FJT64_021659 [Amphibalanus amphitrite]